MNLWKSVKELILNLLLFLFDKLFNYLSNYFNFIFEDAYDPECMSCTDLVPKHVCSECPFVSVCDCTEVENAES